MVKTRLKLASKVPSVSGVYKVQKRKAIYGARRIGAPVIENTLTDNQTSGRGVAATLFGKFSNIRSAPPKTDRRYIQTLFASEHRSHKTGDDNTLDPIKIHLDHLSEEHYSIPFELMKSLKVVRCERPKNRFWSYAFAYDRGPHTEVASPFFSQEIKFVDRLTLQEWALSGSPSRPELNPDSKWVHEPEGILLRLENKDDYPKDYEASVLFAEVQSFRGELRTRLLKALGTYIDLHRFVEDQDSLVTLCSAIRKYAMNMPELHFEGYANWLLPTETATLHHEAEMEFAKGICWRLEFEPHVWPAEYPVLTKTLFDLVDSYLTPRLILQKSYANTAMFGMVALHVLEAISTSRKETVGNLRRKMVHTDVKWFVEMVDDNVDQAIHYISERDAELAKKVTEIRQG